MPFQVNGQFVTTKSSRLPHVAGCGGAFAVTEGAAFAAMMSSADASVAHAAPASPSIIAVETPNFFMLPPPDRFESDRSSRCIQAVRAIAHSHRPILFHYYS